MLRVFFCLLCVAVAEEPWKFYGEKHGVTVERRAVAGSKYFEHRASISVAQPPEVVERAIWAGITESTPKTVKRRTVLTHSDDEYVVYDEYSTPVVTDRDAVIRIHRQKGEVDFHTVDNLGPPLNPHYVRLPIVRGAWTIVAEGAGSRLVYSCYSEPGGSVPAWMVRGPQADQVFADVQRILDRLAHVQ
jgi:hypothetical protein